MSESPYRVIFHLDMDAFFASVEQRDRPELRGKPVIVGGPANGRGVVCAASYEARKFGVRSAMPSATARRLCPSGLFIPVRMEAYKQESGEIMQILQRCGAMIEQTSIDEAYMDLSSVMLPDGLEGEKTDPYSVDDHDAVLQQALPLARSLKDMIRAERRLTASIGVASNKLLAKLASDYMKPDGLTVISESQKVSFLRPLPIRSIHGVGRVTEGILQQAGIKTVADLQDYRGDLRALTGSFGPQLREFALGRDSRPLEIDDTIKSISSEETFERDTDDRRLLKASLRSQCEDVARKMARRQLTAKTVQVKIRYGDFKTLTRQLSVDGRITQSVEIYRLACFLLGREKIVNRPLRLLGVGVSNLDTGHETQLVLPLSDLSAGTTSQVAK